MTKTEGFTRRALIGSAPLLPIAWAKREFAQRNPAGPSSSLALGRAPDARPPPSKRITLGFIGVGRQGVFLLGRFLREPDVQVLAVCDVDRTRRDNAKRIVDDHEAQQANHRGLGEGCASYNDHREVVGRRDVDAVVIATPDHWHALQAIDACKARKDVYCEKPLTDTVHEAHAVLEAARKYGRVFQTGSQQRVEYDGRFRIACEYVRSGRLGKLLAVYTGFPGGSGRWCDLPEEPMEPGLDWDRWLGPAPLRPYHSALSPRGVHDLPPSWRLYREYAGGAVSDWGSHHFDIAQWALDADRSGPTDVIPPEDPRAEHGVRFIYPNGVELIHAGPPGITFVGASGSIFVDRSHLTSNPETLLQEPLGDKDVRLPQRPSLVRDWLDCLKTRKRPVCDVEVGARSANVCHLANLAYWNRRRLRWDPQAWKISGDEGAAAWLDRERRDPYKLPKA
jgi:predicted dehydrogenase